MSLTMVETSQQRASVSDLVSRLSPAQRRAQLVGLWAGARRDDNAAPMQDQLVSDTVHVTAFAAEGLGQLTRHYGTTPISAVDGLALLRERQQWLVEHSSVGIPALVHEECLTGVMAWGATAYPSPLAWGATFDPPIVQRMAGRIGGDLAALGAHQGLAPVLDVVRDLRWGRVEECISEDPVLVGEIGAAYVAGIEAEGVVSTLKHFVGYSASRGGRNHAPVSIGTRELQDVFLPPFERAVRAGARSVMNSYADVDGVPPAASAELLTGILRERWGFEGTVVADYFAIAFLESMHHVAADASDAAAQALHAGVDVELPTGAAYLAPLAAAIADGAIDAAFVDRALERVLAQKKQLGLLDGGGIPEAADVDLDSEENRGVARELARRSIVLVSNDGVLPLGPSVARIAVIGPNADRAEALFGCYSFVNHVLPRHPDVPRGLDAPTVLEALRAQLPDARISTALGSTVTGDDRAGFDDAVAVARDADVAIVVVGDASGMFGNGTSGEGCDVEDLRLPGVQHPLVEAVLASGTPTILVVMSGRPYALDAFVDRCAAVVQSFLPGQEGGTALAEILTGAVVPSGRLPVGLPGDDSPQPSGYLAPALGAKTAMSSADPTPLRPFGFGMSYTTFARDPLRVDDPHVPSGTDIHAEITVRNTGERAGADVLQLYVHHPVAEVALPLRRLVAFLRVPLDAGEEQTWRVRIPSATLAYTGRDGRRGVRAGAVELILAADAHDEGTRVELSIEGDGVMGGALAEPAVWERSGTLTRSPHAGV
jgi:beta-xylosidase